MSESTLGQRAALLLDLGGRAESFARELGPAMTRPAKVFGLFSGIGGLELGFHKAGYTTVGLCEIDEDCRSVLARAFPGVPLEPDIFGLDELPEVNIVVAGFPCKPFSQAGPTLGMGASHALLAQLFRIVRNGRVLPAHIVFENVPNIIHLDRGEALSYITRNLESLGYSWAYRIVDAMEFDLPQRRRRWVMIASLCDVVPRRLFLRPRIRCKSTREPEAHGFYWTEGNRGLGWADDAIPPLKSGSTISIPSPPAIWDRNNRLIVTPHIRDAERLQGFDPDWTRLPGETSRLERARWRMVGNAVSVPMSRWLASLLGSAVVEPPLEKGRQFAKSGPWPIAAYGAKGWRFAVSSEETTITAHLPIMQFLLEKPVPLSLRATRGFRERLEASTLWRPSEFVADLRFHERRVRHSEMYAEQDI